MFITEYDQARAFAEQREEGYELGKADGIEIGVAKGTLNLLMKLVENGTFSVSEAAKLAEMPLFEFETKIGLKAGHATS